MELDRLINDLGNPDIIMTQQKHTKNSFYGRLHSSYKITVLRKTHDFNVVAKALIEVAYSFKMSDTNFDRFKNHFVDSEKNTKSETCSALAICELIFGNDGSDIVCSSNDDMQANILYDAIDTMRFNDRSKTARYMEKSTVYQK